MTQRMFITPEASICPQPPSLPRNAKTKHIGHTHVMNSLKHPCEPALTPKTLNPQNTDARSSGVQKWAFPKTGVLLLYSKLNRIPLKIDPQKGYPYLRKPPNGGRRRLSEKGPLTPSRCMAQKPEDPLLVWGFRVWGLGFRVGVWGLGFGFGVSLGFGVWGFRV